MALAISVPVNVFVTASQTYAACRIDQISIRGPRKVNRKTGLRQVLGGISVLAYDRHRGRHGFFPVTSLCVGYGDGFEVSTKFGSVVGVSSDPSLYVYDLSNGWLARRSPVDAVGLPVPIVSKFNQRQVISEINLSSLDLVSNYRGRRPKQLVSNVDATFDFGWWLGAAVSDAWPSRNAVYYAKTEPALLKRFIQYCGVLVPGVNHRVSITRNSDEQSIFGSATGSYVTFGSVALARLLEDWFYDSNFIYDSKHKRLPPFFAHLPEDCLWGLLSGLIDGDGSISSTDYSCHFTTASAGLVEDVKMLGKLLGLRVSNTQGAFGQINTMRFVTADVYANRDFIRLFEPSKRNLLSRMPAPKRDATDMVPLPQPILAALRPLLRRVNLNRRLAFGRPPIGNLVTRTSADSCRKLLVYNGFSGGVFNRWYKLVGDNSVRWDVVMGVLPLPKQTTYDVCIRGASGLIVGNGLVICSKENWFD